MNFKKLFFLLSLILVVFSSCNKDDDEFDVDAILGTWQFSNIERFEISTNNDSLSAAIRYAEIRARRDSTIMKFEGDSLFLYNKKGTNIEAYKYSFDGKDKLTIWTSESESETRKFEVIGNIVIYKTGPVINYQNKDGSIDEGIFRQLVAIYPETMKGLEIKKLKIHNIHFYELFKRQMLYY